MSMDSVDDLEYAEGMLTAAQLVGYCRPTCQWLDEGECHAGDTCGCPCGHGTNEESDEPRH